MMVSRDAKIRETMRWFAEEERELRGFSQDPDADFLDWGGDQQGRGTACLAARTRKACHEMKVKLKLQGDQMVVVTPESEQKVKSAIGIGHFLTQRVVRPEKLKKLIAKEVHRASYTTLQANEVSNLNLTDVYGYKSDAYFRFLVVGEQIVCRPQLTSNDGLDDGSRLKARRRREVRFRTVRGAAQISGRYSPTC
jgi:hypothetical protein